jgi:hypothetical protein
MGRAAILAGMAKRLEPFDAVAFGPGPRDIVMRRRRIEPHIRASTLRTLATSRRKIGVCGIVIS